MALQIEEVLAAAIAPLTALVIIVVHHRRLRRQERADESAPGADEPASSHAPPARPSDALLQAFTPGASFGDGEERITIEVHRIGSLVTSSGKVIACDPLVYPESIPFTREVPRGNHPVEVSLTRLPSGDQRVAAARVVFGAGTPVVWELAQAEDGVAYGVDAGLGCFMDAEAGRLLVAATEALPPGQNYYDDVIARELEDETGKQRDWTNHSPAPERPENVIIFSSGWGDGLYTSWWALDAKGEPLALVTDFQVLG